MGKHFKELKADATDREAATALLQDEGDLGRLLSEAVAFTKEGFTEGSSEDPEGFAKWEARVKAWLVKAEEALVRV